MTYLGTVELPQQRLGGGNDLPGNCGTVATQLGGVVSSQIGAWASIPLHLVVKGLGSKPQELVKIEVMAIFNPISDYLIGYLLLNYHLSFLLCVGAPIRT